MGRGHGVTAIVAAAADEEMFGGKPGSAMTLQVRGKPGLNTVPSGLVDDSRMLPVMDVPLVREPADIDRVRQDLVEMPPAERLATAPPPGSVNPLRDEDVVLMKLFIQRAHRSASTMPCPPASPSSTQASESKLIRLG